MNKRLIGVLILFIVLGFPKKGWAYDLTLTGVGSQSTLGVDYSLVNYTGGVPTLAGTASPSAQVGIKINTILNYTTASTSGIWQFIPSSLNQGDNQVVLSSGQQSISFVLRFNSTASGEIATPAAVITESELPDSGVWEYYLPAVAFGLGVFWVGRYGKKKMQKWEKGD